METDQSDTVRTATTSATRPRKASCTSITAVYQISGTVTWRSRGTWRMASSGQSKNEQVLMRGIFRKIYIELVCIKCTPTWFIYYMYHYQLMYSTSFLFINWSVWEFVVWWTCFQVSISFKKKPKIILCLNSQFAKRGSANRIQAAVGDGRRVPANNCRGGPATVDWGWEEVAKSIWNLAASGTVHSQRWYPHCMLINF